MTALLYSHMRSYESNMIICLTPPFGVNPAPPHPFAVCYHSPGLFSMTWRVSMQGGLLWSSWILVIGVLERRA